MIEGALILLGGWLAGWLSKSAFSKLRQAKPSAQIETVCECRHLWSSHTAKKCTVQVKREHYTVLGDRSGYEYAPCACLRYVGPIPIEAYSSEGLPGFTQLGD